MKRCIYCCNVKAEEEFTLEHVIPQCLGGAYAPDQFKVRSVCKRCNSNLGLFVDAGFEKNWFVSNKLREIAYSTFDPESDAGLPLICMGQSDLAPPQMRTGETCESWLGPLGEQVYWVRQHDERLYWYTGGNPRTAKDVESRAYFMFGERSGKNPLLPWRAFRDAFEGRRVKKVMCTTVLGADPKTIGFEEPDELDRTRAAFFVSNCTSSGSRKNQLSLYISYDVRFMAKLAIGIAYSLFGQRALDTEYAAQLYKGLWHRPDEEIPEINGTTDLMKMHDPRFSRIMGDSTCITIAILPVPDGVAVNLNIGESMNWVIRCASKENLREEDIAALGHGRVLVLYRQLQRGVDVPMSDFLAHKLGNLVHPQLADIGAKLGLHKDYFRNL
ncbi:HNH endonuclease [Caballeronia concitans]|uniref:HNH endonuclease 5 domain-containing protein n=1 Tax=Caballeronia concitans TaxID=1777133 RepID=A0A658R426_9BURK|nr:HNH endonuclease [Caballeronia concitans]SAL48948.1 hypothetical protein AWB72_05110 [Caballeronia concitans]